MEEYIGQSEKDRADRTKRFFGEHHDKLINSQVLVVGAGAVGNEVIKNLAMLGIKNIHVVDFDLVSISNLNRCIFFRDEDHDKIHKVDAIKREIEIMFKDVTVHAYKTSVQEAPEHIWEIPLVIVAVDNNEARYYINLRCFSVAPTPFIINGAMGRTFCEVQVLRPKETACMTCLWSKDYWQKMFQRLSRENCDEFFFRTAERFPAISVISSLLGSIMASEAIKILINDDDKESDLKPQLGKSIRYDIRKHESSCGIIYRNTQCGEIFCRRAFHKKS